MFKDAREEIRTLVRLSTLVNSSLDLKEVLDHAMKYVEDVMDAEASSIFLVDYDKHELYFSVARGEEGAKVKEIRLKIGEGLAGWVAKEDQPVLVPDAQSDPRFFQRADAQSGFKTRSLICVPIKNKGRLLGVLQVLNRRSGTFDEEDQELLIVVANQIGSAMENARLYQRLQAKFALTAEELKRTEQKLIHSERLAAMGRLSQGVAHEVRNPVMSIGGFARRLKKMLPADSPGLQHVEIILNEAARLERMVKQIEVYTSLRTPELKELNLNSLLADGAAQWCKEASRPDIQVKLDLPETEILLPGDAELLTQVFGQLYGNAMDAMPQGGTLSIIARPTEQWVEIKVADTGVGIAAEALPQIFDPFFTAKPQGAGLGLTTVHRIIDEHQGDISVDSAPGRGTEFVIRLPLYPDDMQLSTLEQKDSLLK